MKSNIIPFGKGFNYVVKTYSSKIAFVDFDTKKSFTYNEVDVLVKRCLSFLKESGLKKWCLSSCFTKLSRTFNFISCRW